MTPRKRRKQSSEAVVIGRLRNNSNPVDPDTDLTIRWSPGYARMIQILKHEYKLTITQICSILGMLPKVVTAYYENRAGSKTTDLEKSIIEKLPPQLAIQVLGEIQKSEITLEQMTRRCVALSAEADRLKAHQEAVKEVFRSPLAIKLDESGVREKTVEEIEKEVRREVRQAQKLKASGGASGSSSTS